MADIALRSYLEEIDGLIDGNRVEEAIAHLKHILGIYPKDLDAYRLLAKALLEKNRHLDAADVFQRVLSSVPDDFIAHIGMAVVREDEGNLDAAIWHMERAYEVQPSSQPIQEELRRLFSKRDGGDPPRLRLSRAALARMYEKGDLYLQAIGEIRAALRDEPDRLDLKVMLASALWRSKQRAEAAETSAKLLEVLPFCKEANRILANVWTDSGRPQEAQNYKRRLEALDPYEAFAEPGQNGHGAGLVDPDQVVLPHLENVYGETATDASRPDWMEALGIQYDQGSPTEAATSGGGEWLDTLTGQNESRQGATPGAAAPLPGTDWLSSLRGEDLPATGSLAATPSAGTTVNNTDSPDWLSGLGISDETIGIESTASAVAGGTDWLTDMMGGDANRAVQSSPVADNSADDIPAWMNEDLSASRPAEAAQPADQGTGMTGWLAALGGDAQTELMPTPSKPEAGATDSDMPDWIKSEASANSLENSNATAASDSETPAWLSDSPAESSSMPTDAMPDWLQRNEEAELPSSEIPDWSKSATEPETSMPDWLGNAEQTATPQASDNEVPDWLSAAAGDNLASPTGDTTQPSDLPDWLASAPSSQPEKAASVEDLSDWLSSTAESEPKVANASASVEPGANADVPAWLATNAPAPETSPEDIPSWLDAASPVADKGKTAEVPDWLTASESTSEDESLNWLTAEAQTEEIPAASPADSKAGNEDLSDTNKAEEMARADEEMPEWMKAAGWIPRDPSIPLDSASNLEGLEPDEEAVEDDTPALAEVPDWLKAMKPAEEARPAAASGDAPDWLRKAMEGGDEAADNTPAPETPAAKPVTADELPDWLKASTGDPNETVAKFLKTQPAMPSPANDLPDWLQESGAGADSAAETEPSPTPDWRMANEITEATRAESVPELAPDVEGKDWLKSPARDTAEAVATYLREQAEPPTGDADRPAANQAEEQSKPEATSVAPAEMSADEALAWLEGLAAKQGANEEELVTKRGAELSSSDLPPVSPEPEGFTPEAAAETIELTNDLPGWLKAPIDAQDTAAPTVPDWLQVSTEDSNGSDKDAGPEPEIPDWLNLSAEEPALNLHEMGTKPIGPKAPEVEEAAMGLPDWLDIPAAATETTLEAEDSQITRPVDMTSGISVEPKEMSEDEALAWLEGLAAKQGANPEELVSDPADRPASEPRTGSMADLELDAPIVSAPVDSERPFGTVEAEVEETTRSDKSEELLEGVDLAQDKPPLSNAAGEMSADEALAWLEGLAAKQGAAAEELVSKPEDRAAEMPTWVQDEARTIEASTAQTTPLGSLPESEVGDTQPEEPATAEPAALDEKPDWLKQMEAESDAYEATARGETPAPPEASATADMSADAALAWLESLAAKQGAAAEELVSNPEARPEDMPAWIKHEAEASEEEPAEAETDSFESVEIVEDQAEEEEGEVEAPAEAEPDTADEAGTEESSNVEESVAFEAVTPVAAVESDETYLEPTEPEGERPTEELPAWLTVPVTDETDEPLTIAGWTPLENSEPEAQESEIIETPSWVRATETPEVTLVEVQSRPEPEIARPPVKPETKPEKPARRAKSPRKATRRSSRSTKLQSSEEPATVLARARQHLSDANVTGAVEVYSELINSGHFNSEIIEDLESANMRNPGHPELLRTLGDAYMRDNQLQKALDSYKQALQQL